VKTANLTPWCNLFSTASKYNICIKKSCYQHLLYAGSVVTFILLSIVFFTFAYHLALSIAVFFLFLVGLLLANKKPQQVSSSFELNSQGLCSFNGNHYYQLQTSSRYSFFGCWLILKPVPTESAQFNVTDKNAKTRCFIYRDSLSKQDFSRVSKVISHLHRYS